MALSVNPAIGGTGSVCGIRSGGELVCWNDGTSTYRPPEGRFSVLDAGPEAVCGVRVDGEVVCWGPAALAWSVPPGDFTSLSVGKRHACGLTSDGTVACWGDEQQEAMSAPGGEFVAVDAGDGLSCGVRPGGTVECWGGDEWWATSPPPGEFVAVDTDRAAACGLRRGGEVECWGRLGALGLPEGVYAALNVGGRACGLRPGGTFECWVAPARGLSAADADISRVESGESPVQVVADSPGGEFVAVSGWDTHMRAPPRCHGAVLGPGPPVVGIHTSGIL